MRLTRPRVLAPILLLLSTATAAAGPAAAELDRPILEEMLRSAKGRLEQWTASPELVILTSVMQYQAGASEYVATSDVLTDREVDELIADLTTSLRLLTGNAFEHFASIRREDLAPGTSTPIIRAHQIVIGRFRDVQRQTGMLGLGGRSAFADGRINGAAVLLDDDYDRTGTLRLLLRTHELGHALGFNHVESRPSIMNERIGSQTTELDLRIGEAAYRGRPQTR